MSNVVEFRKPDAPHLSGIRCPLRSPCSSGQRKARQGLPPRLMANACACKAHLTVSQN